MRFLAVVAVFLVLTLGASLTLLPNADAHSPPWTIISYAYISVSPNPVGVGQTVAVLMWADYPLPGSSMNNDIRRHDYTLTITKPDSTTETKKWDVITDTTGVQYFQYVPDQTGNYTFFFQYPQQIFTWSGIYNGDIFLAANATTTLVVQEEQVPPAIDSFPLPSEYWTRPIEGQNTYWYTIASNWLGAPFILGALPSGTHGPGGYQFDGIAPNSAHIMWSKPIQFGGIVGGNDTQVPGEMFYQGGSYNVRWLNPLIMYGTLYYQEPWGNSGTGGAYVALNLRTGEELWRINVTSTGTSLVPQFGYLYAYDEPNQHGVIPNGLLIAPYTSGGVTVWRAYDPRTGILTNLNVTNVPGGSNVAGPSGEYLKYILTNYGTASNPNYYLAQWNSSKVFTTSLTTVNASTPNCYDWNVSIPSLKGSGWSIAGANNNILPLIDPDNILLLVQGTFGCHVGMTATITASLTTDPVNVTAISLKPDEIGRVLWTKTYEQAPENITRTIVGWDLGNNVFITEDKETFKHHGWSLTNGELVWEATAPETPTVGWNFFSLDHSSIAYGKLYYYGYSGLLYCYDTKDGDLLWIYGNGGEGNSTSSGFYTPYGVYPIFASAIADGKIFFTTTEHSPNSPMWKGAKLICINATTGEEIWKIYNYGNNMYGGNTPIADGYLTFLNTYDCQIYCIGKGPSRLTVSAPQGGIELGKSLVISGTITDISAGTKQPEQAARFPNGVPCVSDESMSAWMEYVYMQKPRPTNLTGVPITLSVIDSNNNYREIGTVISNADGYFSLSWKPDIEGSYTVFATFAGSESYWPSHSVASFVVDPGPATPIPQPTQPPSVADLYFIPAVAGLFIAIIAVGLLTVLMLRKRP